MLTPGRRPWVARLPWVAVAVAVLTLLGCTRAPERNAATPDPYRRAVGGLGAGYLLQTHVSIGAIANLLEQDIYATKEVEVLMDTAIGMGDNVAVMLEALSTTEMGPGDASTVARMSRVNALLSEQAAALRVFARGRSQEAGVRFAESRRRTWRELRHLLDVAPRVAPAGAMPESG